MKNKIQVGGMVPNYVPVKTAKVKVQDGLKVKAMGVFAKGLKDGTVYTLRLAAPYGGEDTYSFVAKGKVVARFPESAVERFLENGESGDSNGLRMVC